MTQLQLINHRVFPLRRTGSTQTLLEILQRVTPDERFIYLFLSSWSNLTKRLYVIESKDNSIAVSNRSSKHRLADLFLVFGSLPIQVEKSLVLMAESKCRGGRQDVRQVGPF